MNWHIKMVMMSLLMAGLWGARTIWHLPIFNLFYVWGLIMWIGTVVRYIYFWIEKLTTFRHAIIERLSHVFSVCWAIVQTFVFITFTRLFFRSGSNLDPATANQEAWETATNMVNQIGGAWNSSIIPAFLWEYRTIVFLFTLGMIIHWLPSRSKRWIRMQFCSFPIWIMLLFVVATVFIVYQFVTADLQAFIYFQF